MPHKDRAKRLEYKRQYNRKYGPAYRQKNRTRLNERAAKWRKTHRSSVNATVRKRYKLQRLALLDHKIARGCADCGDHRGPVLDFHHNGHKKFAMASAKAKVSLARLLVEASQCEVLCANCHRMRHAKVS